MSDKKQALWECINWYIASLGTKEEKRERKVLDQAIDAALADTATADVEAESTESICSEILALLGVSGHPSTDLLNVVAGFGLRCENDGRREEHLVERVKAMEFKHGSLPDRRATADAPLEVTEEMVEAGMKAASGKWLFSSPTECYYEVDKILRAALTARKEG
jgi:hypothetical protein